MTSLRHVSLIENTCAFLFLKLFYFWNIYFVSEQSWLVKIIQSMYTSAKSHIMTSGQKVETAEAAYGRDSTPVVPTSPNTHSFRNVLLEQECQKKFWLLDICYPFSSKSTFDCMYLCEMPLQSLIPPRILKMALSIFKVHWFQPFSQTTLVPYLRE